MITEIHASNKIYIKFIDTKKCWGVFCKEKILKDLEIEIANKKNIISIINYYNPNNK